MKLKTAVTIFVALLLGLFAALSVSLVRISDLLDRSGRDLAMAGESIRLAEELKSSLLTHNRDAFLYTLQHEPARMETRRTQRIEILNLLKSMRMITNDPNEVSVLGELTGEIAAYLERRRELSISRFSPTEQYEQISRHVDESIAVADRLINLNHRQMSDLMGEINKRNHIAMLTALGLLSLGGIFLLGLIGAIFGFVARPLFRLAQSVEKYGEGHSTVRADSRGLKEIREIAGNFNCMADHLEERRKEQSQFIASIAHDLRNPLHSISLVSELLVHKSTEENRELTKLVLRQVKNLDYLVQDLLDTSRIEAGQLDLRLSVHDLKPLVKDVVELHRSGTQRHKFVLDLPDKPILCRYDRGRLSQVLNNLVTNAIKYSPDGGVISVEVLQEEERVRVSVADQGIGIPPEDLDNIFKPFHRTAITRGKIPGIGLGLAASRRIIEAHGGALTVESIQGTGSTFQISLPCEFETNTPFLPCGGEKNEFPLIKPMSH
jgi:signal transduction histidine kinase